MNGIGRKLFYAAFLALCLTVVWDSEVSAQSFPYQVSVQAVSGHCYDDAHLIFTLTDDNGNVVQIDPETHNTVNTSPYPLLNVQYHYQNVGSGLGVQYDYNNDVMLTAGAYNVGVRGYIPSPNGTNTVVDTTIYNVQVTTSYQHLEAAALYNLASGDWNNLEMKGWRPSFTCADLGRIQLHITQGSFPYEVSILNAQQDTLKHTFFSARVNSGSFENYANYRDYYTFDQIPVGTYSIFVSDSCGYTIGPISFTIPNAEPSSYGSYVDVNNYSCPNENIIPISISFYHSSEYNSSYSWYNYMHTYFDSILQYRYINPGNDTTEWKVIVPTSAWYSNYFNRVDDTLPNYCVIFNDTVTLQIRDLCHDTLRTYKFLFLPQFNFIDSAKMTHIWDTAVQDTCAVHLLSGVSTQTYKIGGDEASIFNQTGGSLLGVVNQVRNIPFRYYKCPLSYNVWSMPDSILLGHSESDEFTGLGTWVTFGVDTAVQLHISVTDAEGCEVAAKDTILEYHPIPIDDLYPWFECRNEKDDDGRDHCCEERYLWIQEHGVEANTFRRDMTLHLIESPLYNHFNFTAIRQDGVWNTTFDDPTNHSSYVDFSYPDGWRATLRDSVCLPPGRYKFEVSTACGVDTVIYEWAGFYYDTHEFASAPQYEIEQVCDRIVVTQVSTGIEAYVYFIDPSVSNDIPIQEPCQYDFVSSASSGINPITDSHGRKVYSFSVPGTYYITNYSYNRLILSGINTAYVDCIPDCYHYDSITVAFSYIDFDMAAALLCDSSATTGIVTAQAINGNAPYTYTLYNQWDATGNVIASNSTGFFDNVPMMEGQHFTVQVTDSCSTSFSINITAALLTNGNLAWEEGSNGGTHHCAGDTVHLTALFFPPPATYQWTGPNGYSSTSQNNDFVVSSEAESGWYKMSVLNSLCGPTISDSVYISVAPPTQNHTVYFCTGDTVTLAAANGTGAQSYLWNNGETDNIITVSESGVYTVTAYYSGCSLVSDEFHVFESENPILGVHLSDMVAGDTQIVVIGNLASDNLQYSNPLSTLTYSTVTFLPDGEPCDPLGCSYEAEMAFSGFPDTAVIHSAEDIRYIRLKMEHSSPIDLYINLKCPNGQQADILKKYNGNSISQCISSIGDSHKGWPIGNVNDVYNIHWPFKRAYMGIPNTLPADNDPTHRCDPTKNMPGTGWNYCWSDNTTEGYQYASANGCLVDTSNAILYYNGGTSLNNLVQIKIDSSNMAEGSQFYHPDVSFDSLAGCPVNGIWTVEVIDGVMNDNGYIFECEMGVNELLAGNHYVPLAQMNFDSAWVTRLTDSTFIITPPETLVHDTTLAYTFTLVDENGCVFDTTVYITIYAHKSIDLYDTVYADSLPYVWEGLTFTHAGCQDTLLYTAHGADSLVTLHLSVIYYYDTAVCENMTPLYWLNQSFYTTSSVSYIYHLGCADSIRLFEVKVHPVYRDTLQHTICENNLPFHWHDNDYFTTDIYYDSSTSSVTNCDSIFVLSLTVLTISADTFATACDSFVWRGITYYETPAIPPTDTVAGGNENGCDLVTILHLTIHHSVNTIDSVSICESDLPYTYGDTIFPIGTSSDDYVFYDTTANGCDSIATLKLRVTQNVYTTQASIKICESMLPADWFGHIIPSGILGDTTIIDTFPASNGCDSIVTRKLNIGAISDTTIVDTIVENLLPYTLNGSNYYSSGIYFDTCMNTAGCDSVITLILTVLYNVTGVADSTICDNMLPFYWNGVTFTNPGTQITVIPQPDGTDSILTMNLTANPTPTVLISGPPVICTDDFAELTAVSDINVIYIWSTGDTTSSIITNITGTYYVTVTNEYNCTATATQDLNESVIVNPISALQFPDLCAGNDFFGWELALGPHQVPNPLSDVTSVTVDGPWVTTVGDTAFVFSPPADLPHDTVVSYMFHFQNQYDCSYDTTVYLNVYAQSHSYIDTSACGSFVWNGITYTQSDTITIHDTNVHGCDSNIVIYLTIHPNPLVTVTGLPIPCVDDTAILHASCTDPTASFLWSTGSSDDSIIVTTPGDYSITATNAECNYDTLISVAFTSPNQSTTDTIVCDSFFWNGTDYTQTGIYVDTLTNAVGCDSIVTLLLTVNYSFITYDTLQLTQNQLPYYFAPSDTTFPQGSPSEFQFSYIFPAQNGCDSTIMEKVYVYVNYSAFFDTTVCADALPLQWHGRTFTASGTVTDSLQTVHGSDSVMTFTVTVDTISATIGNITHINCYGESSGSATATVTGGMMPLSYQWTNGAGNAVSATTQISNRPADTYTFTVTDAIGCFVTDSVTLNTLHGEMLPGTITGPQALCFGDTLGTVSGTAATGDNCTYQWQISTDSNTWGPASGTNNTQNYTLLTPATSDFLLRRAWISGDCGTLYSDTLTVAVWPVSSDTIYDEICEGQPYQQHGFNISATETMGQGTVTFVEQYTNTNGCDSTVSLLLVIHQSQTTTFAEEICEGNDYYDNGFEIPAAETIGKDTLLRILNLQTTDGCDSVVRFEAAVIDTALRIESLTNDFCEDMVAELVAVTNMTDYEWSTGEQLPNITVTTPGTYGVTASQGGCSVSARYVIEPCIFELHLPNAISPGREDGLNDYFGISEHAQEMINLFEISIFDRWGELVFYSTDKGFRWNGEVKGQIYFQNVYNYVIRYTDSTGRPFKVTGTLTVL